MGLWALESVLSYGNRQDVDNFKFDPIAVTVFGAAKVIFEVRAPHWRMRGKR